MRLVLLRVVGRDGERPHLVRAVVRLIGLGLATVTSSPASFPSWSTKRRRALQDFMACTVVGCADLEPPAGNPRSDTPSRAASDAVQRG